MSGTGILLLAHGSRDTNWKLSFEAIGEETKRRFPGHVCLAYLESMSPDFATGINELAARGVERIRIVPVFLAAGSHIRVQIPELVAAAKARHGDIAFDLAVPAGEAEIVRQAIASFAIEQ